MGVRSHSPEKSWAVGSDPTALDHSNRYSTVTLPVLPSTVTIVPSSIRVVQS